MKAQRLTVKLRPYRAVAVKHLLTHKLNNAEVAVVMSISREAVRKLRAKRVSV
jgi:hypothetical protein